jgi:hypothetical protein
MLIKGFIKNTSALNFDKKRFFIALALGLLFAFSFYSFFNVMREIFRLLSVTEYYDIWWFSDKQNHFYNLFFAFISCIFGQSIAIQYYFDKPSFFFRKSIIRTSSVLNDQRVLNLYFLSWFSKLAILFAFLFAMAIKGGFYFLDIFPNYNFVFILIPIVLFLQSWISLRLKLKNKSLKWMLYSFLTITIISFGLSRINYLDFKKTNNVFLEKNILDTYNLNLPESECFEHLDEFNIYEKLFIVKSKNPNDSNPVIIYDNIVINLSDISEIGANFSSRSTYFQMRSVHRLYIDKTIKMEFVNKVKYELARCNILNISYSIKSPDSDYKKDLYSRKIIKEILHPFAHDIPVIKNNRKIPKSEYKIEITQNNKGDIFVDNQKLTPKDLKQKIKEMSDKSYEFVTVFYINDNSEFEDYIKTYSAILASYNSIRNEYSLAKYSMKLDELPYDKRREVMNEIQLNIIISY